MLVKSLQLSFNKIIKSKIFYIIQKNKNLKLVI